ncbi:FAD binding domain-containing protein [Aminiphilus sp.]|uniref:FAD binding domain-containing protein n=1 Tax=Aminiphilus sp. TaxID=1872488 RepID=UPI002623224F|nr:FAD binding domain-containing protein [Aminiphilus sp.]
MRADRPRTLEELRRILRGGGEELRLLAGGTDLVPSLRTHPERDLHLVDLSSLEELRVLRIEGDRLEIGSAVTFDELERSFLVRTHVRALAAAASQVGSPQIRNRGTLGGNVANASPAADGIPALCALGAAVVIEDGEGAEEILSVEEALPLLSERSVGVRRYLRSFRIPLRRSFWSDFAKVGSRRSVTISKLNLALAGCVEEGRLRDPRLFVGAVAPRPVRALEAEALLASPDRSAEARTAFLDALTALVERTIPARASLPYKRRAIRGLGDELWTRLEEVRA